MSWLDIIVDGLIEAQRRSIVGPGDVREHVEHAERLAGVLDRPEHGLDLGSGAGIPGLLLAGFWPDSSWHLVDAARRRTRLLDQVVDRLGWHERVTVCHGRAEDLGRDPSLRARFDLVTARLFASPAVTAECGAPFLAVGGILAVTEPPGADGSRWPADALAPLGLVPEGASGGVQQLRLETLPEGRFPRRAGIPAKRPLF